MHGILPLGGGGVDFFGGAGVGEKVYLDFFGRCGGRVEIEFLGGGSKGN